MNKSTESMTKSSNAITGDKQRGIGVVELLFTIATLGAAVIIAATRGPKIPPYSGD